MSNPSTNQNQSSSHFRHDLPSASSGSNAMHRLLHSYPPAAQANSEHSAKHFSAVCDTPQASASLYPKAFDRWKKLWESAQKSETASQRELSFMHRALINLAQPSLWESSTSFNPTYGTPVIPGSACKGLARHFAKNQLDIGDAHFNGLFESNDPSKKVQFMDAWWVPNSAPGTHKDRSWVREIVTPHHPDFMNTQGQKPATPFDSPKPSPQIAMHGRFLFVVQGPKLWADYALNILQVALETEGIGARTPEYGCIQITGQ
jgi:CRISPR-associated protein Cmr6